VEVASEQRTALEVRLRMGVAISGRVVDAEGHALANMEVLARTSPSATRMRGHEEVRTDEQGRFTVDRLVPGPHELMVYPPGSIGGPIVPATAPAEGVELRAPPRSR
jgi:hypothetical protein